MTRLLLFGGVGENFPALSCGLLFNQQPLDGPLALIVQTEEIAEYCKGITESWNGYADVRIVPLSVGIRGEAAWDAVKAASVIAVGPGKTMAYREAILGGPLADLIVRKVESGTLYAGISAGAILAGERLARDTASGVAVFPALGLLKGVCVEPHYDNSREGSMQYQMSHTGFARGLGIGNTACVEVMDGRAYTMYGEGTCAIWNHGFDGPSRSYYPGMSFCQAE